MNTTPTKFRFLRTPRASVLLLCGALAAPAVMATPVVSQDDTAAPAADSAPADGSGDAGAHVPPGAEARPAVDAPLAAWQGALLDLAWQAASAMPLEPHVRNRSRSQAEVVEACLALDQPARARARLEGIANWQRGEALADLAVWCVQHGATADVDADLERARQVAEAPGDDTWQDWQRARIRAKIAQAHILLGHDEAAARFSNDLEPSEEGHVQVARALAGGKQGYDEQVAALDSAIQAANLDLVRGCIEACTGLYDTNYDDAARRAELEQKLAVAGTKIPRALGIESLVDLAGIALAHGDRDNALALASRAHDMLEANPWVAEDEVPLRALIAGMRGRAGDLDLARKEIADALALYERDQRTIADVFRAGVLRPVAEACQSMGETQTARSIYAQAIEAGALNPNSRPRAQDLVSTCCSMARHGVPPEEALQARLKAIAEALGDPW